MSAPFEELSRLDRLIHEPARLAIATALASCAEADFVFLQRLTGLSKGNLGSHLRKLEDAGLVTITKRFEGKHPRTTAQLTDAGMEAIEQHWGQLERLRHEVRNWRMP